MEIETRISVNIPPMYDISIRVPIRLNTNAYIFNTFGMLWMLSKRNNIRSKEGRDELDESCIEVFRV